MKNSALLFVVLFLLVPVLSHESSALAAEQQIILGTQKPAETPSGMFLNLVYSEAFNRLGRTFVYQTYPAKRSSLLSDNGTLDGELSRIYSYNEVHPNMLRIEEPHWTSGFLAVAAIDSIQLQGWESLRLTGYKVTYMAGIKGCESNLPRVVKPENLEAVMQINHGLNMLLKGRSDLHIGSEMDLLPLLESEEFKGTALRIVGVMERFTAHAFLHKKHQELVPALSGVLQQMKQEGLLDRYRHQAGLLTYLSEQSTVH